MDIELIDETIEALLFVSGNGISISEITELLELQKSEVNHAVNRLKAKYSGKRGIHLLSYNGKIQFGSNPAYADVIASVLNPIKEKELSSAALETIAVIAYKQPVTRLDIEAVRGVNCDYALQVLLKHNLIEVVGRKDVVGKPLLFGTTENFLKRFQIESISQLPDYDELLDNIKVLEDKQKTQTEKVSLYNEFEIPNEEVAATDTASALKQQDANAVGASLTAEATDTAAAPVENAQAESVKVSASGAEVAGVLPPNKINKKPLSKPVAEVPDLPEEEIPAFLIGEKDLQKIN